MQNNQYEYYLRDLGFLLKEKVDEMNSDTKNSDYISGYKRAFYEIISLMQNQAIAFQIDLSKINLEKIDPDADLLGLKKDNKAS